MFIFSNKTELCKCAMFYTAAILRGLEILLLLVLIEMTAFFVYFNFDINLEVMMIGILYMSNFIIFARDSRYCHSASYPSQFCLSVCLSHGWISPKGCKLGSPNLYCRCAKKSSFWTR